MTTTRSDVDGSFTLDGIELSGPFSFNGVMEDSVGHLSFVDNSNTIVTIMARGKVKPNYDTGKVEFEFERVF